MNRALKAILEETLGAGARENKNPFADLCGTLSGEAVAELLEREKEFEHIDPEAWS
ncbi:MAG: hypothetical protein NTU62_05745 [Spirochaetes bacterium]|nr:hypothetical protein [Spirochaetota bacterium]